MHPKKIYDQMAKWHHMPKKEDIPFIPTVVTLIVIMAWAFFMLLHALFWSRDYNLFQNIVTLILSLIIVGCGLGIVWMYWVVRLAPKNAESQPAPPPPTTR